MSGATLRDRRKRLNLSQLRLSRLSQVSRYKIVLFELGDGSLSGEQLARVERTLEHEVGRQMQTLRRFAQEGAESVSEPPAGQVR